MKTGLSIALLVVGIGLLVVGFNAADSLSSSFSKLFTGSPTDKSIWLLIGGTVSLAIGAFGLMRGQKWM